LLSLFLIAGIPAIIDSLPLPELWRDRISLIRWPLLAILALVAMGVLYRYAPARQNPCWHCFSAGTIGAAVLWLVGSAGFSFYVARFSSYDKTYGSLGAVVILLMWFYVTATSSGGLNSPEREARGTRLNGGTEFSPAAYVIRADRYGEQPPTRLQLGVRAAGAGLFLLGLTTVTEIPGISIIPIHGGPAARRMTRSPARWNCRWPLVLETADAATIFSAVRSQLPSARRHSATSRSPCMRTFVQLCR
jgi:hypothetical protein